MNQGGFAVRLELLVMRTYKGKLRSTVNAPEMEQKDHCLRILRGIKFIDGNIDDAINAIEKYVDAEDDTILNEEPLVRLWNVGGA